MSENKEIVELTNEELKNVSGGGTSTPKTYYFGDVYKSSANLVYVVIDEANTSGDVHCDYYNYFSEDSFGLGNYIGKANVNRAFFKNYSYIGQINGYVAK